MKEVKAIRRAMSQFDPWELDEHPTAAYVRGFNTAHRFLERVLTAIEHDLMCSTCGMPAHRGEALAALDALLPDWVTEAEPSEADEVARLGLTIYKLNRRIASKRRQVQGKDHALLRWRRWAEATFFGGVRGGGRDTDLQQRIVDALRGDREAGSTPKGCVQPE